MLQKLQSHPLQSSHIQRLQSWRRKLQLRAAEVYPGVKTRVITALGSLGSISVALQGYVSGIPTNKLINAEQLAIVAFVLFTLAYWTRSLSNNEPIK